MITVLNLIQVGALIAATGGQPAAESVRVERQTYVMGTVLAATVEAADRQTGVAALEFAFEEVRRLEDVLSSWTGESEVGRVNAAPVGTGVRLSAELGEMLRVAEHWSQATGGAFDPAVGALIDAWDARGEGRVPASREISEALAASGEGAFELDLESGAVVRSHERAWLDTGGFGKGAALAAAERVLRANGVETAHLDFGGQILVYGPSDQVGGRWSVGIAHPSHRDVTAHVLELASGSVATSGQSERFVEVAGERIGHILDPRSGMPVPAWGSVTVVAGDPLVADILSTALFVLGPDRGRELAEELDMVGVLILEEKGGEVVKSWNSEFAQFQSNQTLAEIGS